MARILVIDDEKSIRVTLETWLSLRGYEVVTAATLAEGRRKAALDCDAVVLDVFLQGEDGLTWLEGRSSSDPPVILISGHADLPLAVRAVKQGAFDFLEKPLDTDRLALVLDRALERTRLRRELDGLREDRLRDCFVQGPSVRMAQTVALLKRVAPSPLAVLITGPSGSGKEGLARAVHVLSERVGGPLVTVNCAAVAPTLFEAELFGHRKGAFSGALADRKGHFSRAHRGTLFLDEIGEVPLELQAKLLRVLETGEVPVVGGEAPERTDVRIVAATNRDLEAEVKAGRFREDLFFRLNQVPLRVPPLDERRDDIPVLAEFFKDEVVRKTGRPAAFDAEALDYLSARPWPGNVRELRSVVERALVLSDRETVGRDLLEAFDLGRAPGPASDLWEKTLPWAEAKPLLERTYFERQLGKFGGKLTPLAEALGMHPNNLSRKLKELGIR